MDPTVPVGSALPHHLRRLLLRQPHQPVDVRQDRLEHRLHVRDELRAAHEAEVEVEINAEALIRKTQPFFKFLQFAAIMSGKLLNFAEAASDTGVSAPTIREYYQILEDTLIGKFVEPWTKSV